MGKLCSKAGNKYQHCAQSAKWYYLTHSSHQVPSKLWTGISWLLLLQASIVLGTDDSPCASAWSLSYSSSAYSWLFDLERWDGYYHNSTITWTPGLQGSRGGGGSPNIRWNWRYRNLLARVGTPFPHSWGHANTALMKQKSSSLAALSHCSTLSRPGVVFLLVHQYNFKLGLKLQCMIKAVESLACITSW